MDGLIGAKLRVPGPLSPLLTRPRIQKRLDTAVDRAVVVLLVGPSGIGKTAELVRWAPTAERPLAWLTLDGRDNDPRRLWPHLAAALAGATGADLPGAVGADAGSEVYVAALADRVLELPRRPVLVLDEYEHIVDPRVHERLDLLIRACGDRLTTVVAARSRPPLRLERLQLAGRLATLTWTDLRFDPAEAQGLLAEVFGVTADPGTAAALVTATGGWAGGLMLAGAGGVTPLFDGDRAELTDYLLDHVWAGLDPEPREFLLDTAVLGRFSAALADAARGRTDSAGLLDRLRRDGLFLVAEDAQGWVRYQRLFRQALAGRREATDPGRARELHRAAARWHTEHGDREEAVGHALRAADHRMAAALVQELFEEYFQAGRLVTLERWLSALPDEAYRGDPLLVRRGLNLWCTIGRFDERDRWAAAAVPHAHDPARPIGPADVWRLCLARERGDLTLAVRQGRALLRAENPVVRADPLVPAQSRISLARTLLLAGQPGESRRLLAEIEAPLPAPLRVTLHGIAGLAAHLAGDPAAAAGHAGHVRTALAECPARPAPRTAPEAIILAVVTGGGTAPLAELVDADPGLGDDRSMRAFALMLLAREDAAADRLAAAAELLARCPGPLGLTDLWNQVAAGLGPPSEPPVRAAGLSEREVTVLQYLRSDLTLREIADDLFVSVNTVKTHARHVYRKLGVSGRGELAGHPPSLR